MKLSEPISIVDEEYSKKENVCPEEEKEDEPPCVVVDIGEQRGKNQ